MSVGLSPSRWSLHITSQAEAWGRAGTGVLSDAPLPVEMSFILSPSRSGWCGGDSVAADGTTLDSPPCQSLRGMDIPAAAWLVRPGFGSPKDTLWSH